MNYVFNWVESYVNKELWLIKKINNVIVASVRHYRFATYFKYKANIYHYPDNVNTFEIHTVPTHSNEFNTILNAKSWVELNLKNLDYRFIDDKFKVLK